MPIMSVERLRSFDVVDKNGDKVGSLKDLLVDPSDNRIHYVLLGPAGVLPSLGLADKLMAVPVDSFRFEDNRITLLADKDKLKDAPSFSPYSPPDFNRDYETKIADYWGTPHYWDIPLYHLDKTTAKDVMIQNVPTVRPDTPVTEISRIMSEKNVDELPVIDDQGRVIGYAKAQEMTRILGMQEAHPSQPMATPPPEVRTPPPEGRAPAMPEREEQPPAPGL